MQNKQQIEGINQTYTYTKLKKIFTAKFTENEATNLYKTYWIHSGVVLPYAEKHLGDCIFFSLQSFVSPSVFLNHGIGPI